MIDNLNLSLPDTLVIAGYVVVLVILGLRRRSRTSDNTDYLLDGRRLSLPGFVATLVATWYGGIMGIGENTFNFGVQTWFIFGLPYYFFAVLFAWLLAGPIRRQSRLSIPDHFHEKYGRGPAVVSAAFLLILASPAPYILSIGILLQYIFGISYGWALLTATAVSLIYIWFGGFGAVVRTDILQFILMFAGFILLVFFAWAKLGSPRQLIAALPAGHLDPAGGQSIQFIIVWFFIAMWTFIDPGFYQRTAAAASPQTARKGILTAVCFWFIFDLLTLVCGLYARLLVNSDNAGFAFPLLAENLLPPVFLGLFITGLLATIMSTIDSLGLISATTFGRDIIGRLKAQVDDARLSRWGLPLMAAIALLLAWKLPSVVQLWYAIGSVFVPGLLLPFLLTFSRRSFNSRQILPLMIVPVITAGSWYLAGEGGIYPLGLEPFYPGIGVSLIVAVLAVIMSPVNRATFQDKT